MVVPGADKWPACPGRLQVRVAQVGLVQVAVVGQGDGVAVFLRFLAIGKRRYTPGLGAAIDPLVPAALIDEVSQVQHQLDTFIFRRLAVFLQHARPTAIVGLLETLAAGKGEVDLAGLVGRRGGAGTAGSRYRIAATDKAVVVVSVRGQAIDVCAYGVVTGRAGMHLSLQQDIREIAVGTELQQQGQRRSFAIRGNCGQCPGPEHHAIRLRITRGDTLGKFQRLCESHWGRVRRTQGSNGQEECAAGYQFQQAPAG